jgi:mycothiol S-conjugate amidase
VSELCLLSVHAHPDDESSKGAGTVARYHADGVRTVLVSCTGGEEGDILNPAMDRPGVKERIPEIRAEELARATQIIGYDRVYKLGYRDSGMPGTPSNEDPRSFAQAALEEAVGRLVPIIRRERPQVIITYANEQNHYPHPDHLRVNEISEIAFEAAGDPDRYPDAGEPWQPLKMYYTAWSVRRMHAIHRAFLDRGLESPFTDERLARMLERLEHEEPATTVIDIHGFASVGRRALLAHATQVDPNSRAWFGFPPEMDEQLYPYEEYVLARDLTGSSRRQPTGPSGAQPEGNGATNGVRGGASATSAIGEDRPAGDAEPVEDDLFAGVVAPARR